MTVAELIARLKDMPLDAVVMFENFEAIGLEQECQIAKIESFAKTPEFPAGAVLLRGVDE